MAGSSLVQWGTQTVNRIRPLALRTTDTCVIRVRG